MSGTIYVAPAADGTWVAIVSILRGCQARAASRDEAVARVRENFRDYLRVLAEQRFTPPHLDGIDPEGLPVAELDSLRAIPEDFAGALQEHDLRDFLRQYEASRAALLATVRGRTQEKLEASPGAGEWSARDVLEHVLESEALFLSRLEPWPKGDFGTLNAVHRLVAQRLSTLDPEDTAGEHRIAGQRWTVRRVMRRLLEHEYEHLQQLRDTERRLSG